MKTVVLICSTYSPYGGVERVTLGLAKGLLAKGAKVILLTMPGQAWPVRHPHFQQIPMGIRRAHRFVQAWSFNRDVNRYIQSSDAPILFSFDKVTCYTHLHAGGGTHRTFLKIRNNYGTNLGALLRRFSLFHNYILWVEKKGFQNPRLQSVRCNSHMVKSDIQREYKVPEEKLVVIHSGIRWQEMAAAYLQKDSIGAALCRKHHFDPGWRMLLFLGSGFDRKGLDIAIQGLSTLPSDFHLIVVGKGAPNPYVTLADRLGCRERVHFCGPQPQGWRYAACCKALVLPSLYDPFGGAAAEGHAMGVPVLVSDKTGYADWVTDGLNGVILNSPMTSACIGHGFEKLAGLIKQPLWSADQYRHHARNLDDDVILKKLLNTFLQL